MTTLRCDGPGERWEQSSRMWFDHIPHTAEAGRDGWSVSWLEGRDDLTVKQAHDALLIAELSHTYRARALARKDWPKIQRLAQTVGVDPREAVASVRDAEAVDRLRAVVTPIRQVPHLATSGDSDRDILVDRAAAPTVHTPGRVPGQWLGSGAFLDGRPTTDAARSREYKGRRSGIERSR